MSIFVIGINHKTAPITLREQLYFPQEKLSVYLQDILNSGAVEEAVLLSTCNRSELYCEADHFLPAVNWFCKQTVLPSEVIQSALYIYQDEQAVSHIMRVACGLDSMILGEPQILGQMKAAFSESCASSAVDTLFHRLFQQVFIVAKEIRTTTSIGACPVSLASAAVQCVKQQRPQFLRDQVALIGTGEMAQLVRRYLKTQSVDALLLMARSIEKASLLANEMDRVASLDNLASLLAEVDVVFSATGSPTPLITLELMQSVMAVRQDKPILLIDLAVPRDVQPEVSELKGVQVYCIDDLKIIIDQNRQGREHAAAKAEEMIIEKSKAFLGEWHHHDPINHTIRAYRRQIEGMACAELIKAKQLLNQGVDPARVLDTFAHAFTKKLLHTPSVQLRKAGAEGQLELLRLTQQLFSISDVEVERL